MEDVSTMLKVKESDIRKLIRDYLHLKGYFCYYNLQGLGCFPGLPDLVAVKNGKVIHIEVKKPGCKPSEKQVEFQRRLEAHGGIYIVATGIEDLVEIC